MKCECSQKAIIAQLQRNDVIINEKLDDLKTQIEGLVKLNQEVSDIKGAWKVGGFLGYTAVKVVLGITVILGAIYSLKEWIKK